MFYRETIKKNLYLTKQKLVQSETSHKKSHTSRRGKFVMEWTPCFYKDNQHEGFSKQNHSLRRGLPHPITMLVNSHTSHTPLTTPQWGLSCSMPF